MGYACPTCQRAFAEPGFCPFDGKPLVAATAPPDSPTQPAEPPATIEPAQPPKIRPPTADQQAPQPPTIRAFSASEDRAEAKSALRGAVSEYDRMIGETLDGRYFIEKKLGEGGMGVVFAVRHAVIERPLAIKVLKREVMRDTATIRRFVQEAKAASRIGHPNIVDVTDFGTTPEGMTYSVMELVDGITLKKVIKDQAPLPPERAVHIAAQIARALGAAHDKGIVHRDLKPENVFLVDRDGRPDFVKIVDFGIAKVQPLEGADAGPRLTRAGSVFGTPEYMSPEQASGRGDTDHRVDIYALGVILYEMIVGKVPHKGNSPVRTIAMQMLEPAIPPSQARPDLAVPKGLEAVIMKALAKKREDRYATMPALLAALEGLAPELASGEPTLSLPPLPPGADGSEAPPAAAAVASSSVGAPRRARPETKPLHEPEFVARGKQSFDHVFDEEPAPERRSKLPLILGGIVMLAVGAGTVVLVASHLGSTDAPAPATDPTRSPVAVHAPGDAGTPIAVEPPADAAAVLQATPDAGTQVVAATLRDAGVAGGSLVGRPHPKTVTVEVLTRPGDAVVYQGATYRGESGVHLEAPYGTKMTLTCKTMKPVMKGTVTVVFDGSRDAVMCTATRVKFCVDNIKNPFDDCEVDPNAPVTRPEP